ncbi:hypothetical protein DPMN_075396 [Dreissena polymorpha]|uniref:Uncharacterized protein n=1 Tax=Dreissena polymorpha TaxID=45954 RepID=A0A9D3YJH1_DREPO|nr:hypothetical protein DPMN_075396 [Dreissena polymorpha]
MLKAFKSITGLQEPFSFEQEKDDCKILENMDIVPFLPPVFQKNTNGLWNMRMRRYQFYGDA